MKRQAFDESRDQRIANESGADRALMCCAKGCPNRWSVSGEHGRCCVAHAWVDPHRWPQVTQEQLDAETERAVAAMSQASNPEPSPLSKAQKLAALQALQRMHGSPGKGWAYGLRERELHHQGLLPNGRRMTAAQKSAWRDALGSTHDLAGEADHG